MSSDSKNKALLAFEHIKEFVLIFGGNFVVLILLLVVVNYFLAPFDIKTRLESVALEVHELRMDVANLARELKQMRAQSAQAAPAKAAK